MQVVCRPCADYLQTTCRPCAATRQCGQKCCNPPTKWYSSIAPSSLTFSRSFLTGSIVNLRSLCTTPPAAQPASPQLFPLCSCNRSSVIPPTSCKRSPNFTHVCVLSTRGNHFKRKPEFCRRCWCWCCSFLKDASSFFFLVRMFSTSTGTGNQ